MRTKQVSGILKLGYNNDPPFKEVCSRDLSTACRWWFNSTTTEALVKVVYGCSFQSLWLQQPPIEGALQRRIILGADTTWRLKEECGIFKYQPPFPGADPEIFYWRCGGGGREGWGTVQTLVQKGPPLPSQRPRLHVILKFFGPLPYADAPVKDTPLEQPPLWTPVAVGAGNTALRAEANRSEESTQKQSHFLISQEFCLVAKCNARFVKKKINQLKSDIRSCRCENFSLKQASGLEGRIRRPPDPSPWIPHCFLQ